MLLCSVFIYSTVAGRKCEINLIVIVIVRQQMMKIQTSAQFRHDWVYEYRHVIMTLHYHDTLS